MENFGWSLKLKRDITELRQWMTVRFFAEFSRRNLFKYSFKLSVNLLYLCTVSTLPRNKNGTATLSTSKSWPFKVITVVFSLIKHFKRAVPLRFSNKIYLQLSLVLLYHISLVWNFPIVFIITSIHIYHQFVDRSHLNCVALLWIRAYERMEERCKNIERFQDRSLVLIDVKSKLRLATVSKRHFYYHIAFLKLHFKNMRTRICV
jgi:hypothetical protein